MKESEATMLFRVAKRYYEDGQLQSEIAKDEGISRSLVSKLLARARVTGIVKIDISLPEPASKGMLENMLRERLGVQEAIVLSSSENGENEMDEIINAAVQAAMLLPKMLADSTCVGIGFGRTIYKIADELSFFQPMHEMTFVPLNGNSGLYNRYLQTSSITNRFAEKYNSRCFYLNSSCERPKSSELTNFEQAGLDELRLLWNRLDTAIFSLSTASALENYYISEYTEGMPKASTIDPNACGELLSQSFFRDGSFTSFGTGYRLISLPLDKLRNVKKTICVAVGPKKVPSIVWAAKFGFIKTLITDTTTAQLICDYLNGELN